MTIAGVHTLCDLLGDVAGSDQLAIDWQDSGAAALRWLEQEACDLVISDVDMPEMSGFELLAAGAQSLRNLPMALMSARANAALSQAAADAGALRTSCHHPNYSGRAGGTS